MRGVCQPTWEFKSPLSHQTITAHPFGWAVIVLFPENGSAQDLPRSYFGIDDRGKLAFDIHSLTVLLEDGIERGELASDAPVSILAHTLADILYGEMLCWDMSGGAYCFAKRTEEFCNLFLGSIMAPYLIRKDVTQ